MDFSTLDIITFIGFISLVVGVSIYASRKEDTSEDYFLAGRGLSWWLIGISLIASNISTEHFVGMAGQGFKDVGLAVASYEWIAAYTLVIVALFLLPRFLRSGIYTIPQFLEYRYNKWARFIMAFIMLLFYVTVTISVVLSLGSKLMTTLFGWDATYSIWVIGVLAGVYTIYGGLKAVVWSDLVQGITLMLGGVLVTFLGFQEFSTIDPVETSGIFEWIGHKFDMTNSGINNFMEVSEDKMHTILPNDHPEYPWMTILLGGMWIPNIFYWGLNQFITQRTLGAKNIHEGQKGVLFGASLKLIIPFIIIFPGIMAFELYGDEIQQMYGHLEGDVADRAYPHLFKTLLPTGLIGVMLAALFGATMSTLDSLLNSASTIFTIDIYQAHIKPEASQKQLVKTGRIATFVFVVLACLWAPIIGGFEGGMYKFIQLYWGFVQPGLLAAFVMGIIWKKVPPRAVIIGMLLNIPLYGLLLYLVPDIAFLTHMFICFLLIIDFIIIYTIAKPYDKEIVYPVVMDVSLRPKNSIIIWSALVVIATTCLYIVFA